MLASFYERNKRWLSGLGSHVRKSFRARDKAQMRSRPLISRGGWVNKFVSQLIEIITSLPLMNKLLEVRTLMMPFVK